MIELLTILTPIGLLDSTSIIPLCIVFLVVLLTGPNPALKSFALILGIYVATWLAACSSCSVYRAYWTRSTPTSSGSGKILCPRN